MLSTYQKGHSARLDEEFEQSRPFGRIRVGNDHLFWKKTFRWNLLPLSDVLRAYRRIEEVRGKTGCCSNDFSIHKLILLLTNGERLELLIGDSLYRHEPERLIEEMQRQWPQIAYGKE